MIITYKYKDKPTIMWLMVLGVGSFILITMMIKALLGPRELLIDKLLIFSIIGGGSLLCIYAFFSEYIQRKKGLIKENHYYVDLPKDAFDIKIDGKELK